MHDPPKTLAMPAQACLHTATLCNNTTQRGSGSTHTYTPPNTIYDAIAPAHTPQQPANKQRTMQPTNQPTNHPNLAVQETGSSTKNQPRNPTTNQLSRQPTANRPTSQVPVHTGGGGLYNLGGRGIKHTTDQHSTAPDATAVHWATTYHRHIARRREGVTHLPLGVTVYPLLHPNQKN